MAYTHADVVDWAAGVSGVLEVQQATLLRHQRQHNILSPADHSDVENSTASDGDVLQYSGGKWRATALPQPAGGSTYWAETMMMMGG